MTIKIIKEGKITKFTKTCPDCGCEFEYEQEDVNVDLNVYLTSYRGQYGTYVIFPCCGKHLSHNDYIAYYNNDYIAYYNNPNVVHISPEKGSIVTICDNCPNRPNPKYTITGDSPCDWCIKRNLTYK